MGDRRCSVEDRDIYEIMKIDKNQGMKIILDKYTGLVYHIVKNRVYNYSEVEDVTSEIFIELYEKWDKLDSDKGTIKCFIGTLATRRAIDWIRKQKDEVPLEVEILSDEIDILNDLIEKEEKKTILELLNNLKEPDKTFVISRYFLKIPSAELAANYDMNPNTIDKRISRAIETLRDMWKERVL